MNTHKEKSRNSQDKNRNNLKHKSNSFPGQKRDNLKKNKNGNDPDEIPEEHESDNEGTGFHTQSEVNQPRRDADTSFSEQHDVTPPNKKEFPSVGPAKTDFESRPHGRTTGRMIGHEPGTEG